MSVLAPTLTKKEFHNWVKGALAIHFTKDGLKGFVSTEVDQYHRRLLQSVPTANTPNICTCTIKRLPECTSSRSHSHIVSGPRHLCSRGVCNILMDSICKSHRFRGPSWGNTDPQKWCTDAFEVAKCFMSSGGYSQKTSLDETDFNGIMSVINNNTAFATLIQDNLATKSNICNKAREVGHKIRHTPDHLLSDSDLVNFIDDLIQFLLDPACLVNDPLAQDAVRKLRMLKTNHLTIYEKDITEALKDNIRDTFNAEHADLIMKINDHYKRYQRDSVAEIDRIVGVSETKLKKLANKIRDDIRSHAELAKHEIGTYHKSKGEKDFEAQFEDLKKDLITYYQYNESEIPASPLVDEHKVPLEKLYVLPPLWAFNNSYNFSKQNTENGRRATISQLFLSADNVRFKNIYITAKAGFGKTSLSQKLTMIWSQSHSLQESSTAKTEELDAMEYFDLLFLLHLRNFPSELQINETEPLCNLDVLIMKLLSTHMSLDFRYKKEFIQRVLHEKKCLVILDGLDEWSHPSNCHRKPEVPHNNHPNSCTVLTTARDWKIGTIGLSQKDIDRRIEILELDDDTQEKLETNAVQILNENKQNLAGKNIEDFHTQLRTFEIDDIVCIPYIFLQLICCFFGGLYIGKSKCEIYSNITELTLERGLNKNFSLNIHLEPNDNVAVPNCMKTNKTCIRYINLIMKLGELAMVTLFDKKKESSLIFDREKVIQYMTLQEIEFCLKAGLLIQTKDNNVIANRHYTVFFQHKSIQEFMAALYITSEWQNNKNMTLPIHKNDSYISNYLEMENLFIFVCGMNSRVYGCISDQMQKDVEKDIVTRNCRYSYLIDALFSMESYTSMQIKCFQESVRNGENRCFICLHDIIHLAKYSLTEDDLAALKAIMDFNKGEVKSLSLSPEEMIDGHMLSLGSGVFTSLMTLHVTECEKEPVWLAKILTESARTLIILNITGYLTPLDISIKALTGLTCLATLNFDHVTVTHFNLERLFAYIKCNTKLIFLSLKIHCSDHKNRNCGGKYDVALDLHLLKDLQTLKLNDVPVNKLKVPIRIQVLYLDYIYMTHSNLERLYSFIGQTKTLIHLELWRIDCSDHKNQYRECVATLDLHLLKRLTKIDLTVVSCAELHVNPECLQELEFLPREETAATASASFWKNLRGAPVLSSLALWNVASCQEMVQTIPTLLQIRKIKLARINMGSFTLRLSPAMKYLERLELEEVTMSFTAWKELVNSIGELPLKTIVNLSWISMTSQEWKELLLSVNDLSHDVTVRLYRCSGPSAEDWKTVVNEIKSKQLSVIQVLEIDWDGHVSGFVVNYRSDSENESISSISSYSETC